MIAAVPAREGVERSRFGLDALNFCLADVRDGLGPYIAIYLISSASEHWDEASAGLVITLSGVVGLVAQTPAGKWVDGSRRKLHLVAGAAAVVTASCLLLPWQSSFAAVALSQSLAAAAGTVFAPAISAITLGIVGARAFTRRMGRNESFNHLGNAAAATLAGLLAWRWGASAVFWLMAVLAISSIGATTLIPRDAIDDQRARGHAGVSGPELTLWQTLARDRRLLWFALAMALFHLANAAMLTSVGQLLSRVAGAQHATALMSACIVCAQLVMVPVASFAARAAERWGRRPVMLTAFAVLALRGFLYTLSDAPAWLFAVQCLDGVGAGIVGVLFPVIVADLTRGSGRFNTSQGAVATLQGLGAALSATLAGMVIVRQGYTWAFALLATVAVLGMGVFARTVSETREAD